MTAGQPPEPTGSVLDWDPFELVRCRQCDPPGFVVERVRGREVKRHCRACKGTPGWVLRGDPPESPYGLTLDFTGDGACRPYRPRPHT